jgi:hypothetical protein
MYFTPRYIYTKVSVSEKDDFDSKEGPDPEKAAAIASQRLKWAFLCINAVSLTLIAIGAAIFSITRYSASCTCPALPTTVSTTRYTPVTTSEASMPSEAPAGAYSAELTALDNLNTSLLPPAKYECGWSSDEARANGCIFDKLTVSWQPKECTESYSEEFLEALANDGDHDYEYYVDKDKQVGLTHEDLEDYEPPKTYWTTRRQHLTHCSYVMMRFFHSVHTGKRVTTHAASIVHAEHCVRNILKVLKTAPGWEDITTYGYVQYLDC